ncbi:hypothetical protein L6270_00095 [Candidatus Parcubacteria bacterium]|nr:hypothetical protein [Patescibacteria group bacterium]MBU4309555.1 hypothetical protein [Patescibacteria group bacterium]MBU4432341.1 hypothetical protein [Patescibacteria group bacterium]MBU4578057.1 hypothetical protein [Patescibacteria group bacterium]MCG2696435.1 hypothetical protein [Candidatus Parcubacteria bacterium]
MTARESIAATPLIAVFIVSIIMLIHSWWKYFSLENQDLLLSPNSQEALTIADPIAKTLTAGALLLITAVIFFKNQSQNNDHNELSFITRQKKLK